MAHQFSWAKAMKRAERDIEKDIKIMENTGNGDVAMKLKASRAKLKKRIADISA